MEISERELRDLVRTVDEQHRDGMRTIAGDIADVHAETRQYRRRSRRQFLATAGIGAGALTIGTTILPIAGLLPAAAQETAKLTVADIAAFSESVELAAVEAYKAAAGSGKLSAPVVQAGTTFAGHHSEHAKAFAGAAGSQASGKPNAKLVDTISGQLQDAKDEKSVLQIAFDLETAAASTYLFALGILTAIDTAALKLVSSILPIESQHATVLGQVMGKALKDYVPSFETQDKAIDPGKFPVNSTTTTVK